MWRILRDSLRSFCSSSVSPQPSSTIEPASGSTLKAIGLAYSSRRGQGDRPAVEGQPRGLVGHRTDLAVELGDAGAAGAGHGLEGRDLQPDEAGSPGAAAPAPASRPWWCSSGWR